MTLEDDEDCVVYTYRLIDYTKSQFTAEQLSFMQDNIRTNMLPILKQQATQTELIKKCMDNNYAFKYIYQDKNGDYMCSVKLTPEDYK